MKDKIKSLINYNNLIINLIVPGHFDPNTKEYVWLKSEYDKIEEEYLSKKSLQDCSIFIFSLHTENWNPSGEIKLFVKKLIDSKFISVSNFDGLVFNNVENIKSIINIATENKVYTNKVLVTYGHSSGYYIFGDTNPDETTFQGNHNISNFKNYFKPLIHIISNLTQNLFSKKEDNLLQQNTNEKLDLPCISANTLAEAIENSSIGKFNLIVLANCNMQNIDVISTLSPYTNFIIASQTFVPIKAFSFGDLINNHNKIDFAFCKKVIKDSHNYLGDNDTAISMIQTKDVQALVNSTKKIIDYLVTNYYLLEKVITSSRNKIPYINGSKDVYSIDLFHWIKELFNETTWPDNIKQIFEDVTDLTDKIVYVNQLHNQNNLFGICIYFPRFKKEYNDINNGVLYGNETLTNSYFSKNTQWFKLLKMVHK
jgi:hypothetical protein